MNLERIYEYRFQGISKHKKDITWAEITKFILTLAGNPTKVLDPACGELEFLKFVPNSVEKWGFDLQEPKTNIEHIKFKKESIFEANLINNYYDLIFISNFLEHLESSEIAFSLMQKFLNALAPNGKLIVMGPNFKYCSKEYFDCSDHKLILTDISLSEILYSAGFNKIKIVPKFIPYSFRSAIPVNKWLVKMYLNLPFAWKILGKQFLVIATK